MPKKKWLLGVILATIMTLIAGTCSMRLAAAVPAEPTRNTMSSSAAADEASDEGVCTGEADEHTPGETYTAAAPTKCDRPGTDQDGYYIPKFTHPNYNFGDYRVNGKTVGEGYHNLKSGTSSVTITTDYDSGSWTFNFTNVDVKQEAENTYGIEISDRCKKSTVEDMYREVRWTFTNTLESELPEGVTEGPEVHSIYPLATNAEGSVAYKTRYYNSISDGQTVNLPFLQDHDTDGLRPGVWRIVFWRADNGPHADYKRDYAVKRMKITVPSCDKGGSGSGQPSPTFDVSGVLKQLGCARVKAVGDTREYSSVNPVTFKVIKRVKGRKATKRSFTLSANQKGGVVVRKPKRTKTVFVLKAKQPSGKWMRLARKAVKSC